MNRCQRSGIVVFCQRVSVVVQRRSFLSSRIIVNRCRRNRSRHKFVDSLDGISVARRRALLSRTVNRHCQRSDGTTVLVLVFHQQGVLCRLGNWIVLGLLFCTTTNDFNFLSRWWWWLLLLRHLLFLMLLLLRWKGRPNQAQQSHLLDAGSGCRTTVVRVGLLLLLL